MYHSKSATPVDDEKDFEKGRIRSADYDDDDDDDEYDDDNDDDDDDDEDDDLDNGLVVNSSSPRDKWTLIGGMVQSVKKILSKVYNLIFIWANILCKIISF